MIYADTSFLLALFCPDSLTEAALRWYEKADARIAVSAWSVTEFRSNVGVRTRKRMLSRAAALAATQRFDAVIHSSFHMLTPTGAHFELANAWLTRPELALRSGDALHLGIAVGSQCSGLVTFDQSFGISARKLKLPVVVLKALPRAR